MAEHLVEVENLKMYFKKVTGIVKRKTAYIKAVDNISFTIDKGETFGLVGESGCGKTTTGRTIIRLYDPTDGTIRSGLYQKECAAQGFEGLAPDADTQKLVMSIIYEEIKKGEKGSREKFAVIDRALRAMGCDAAILGCTELSVYRVYHGLPDFYVDAMEVLVEKAITVCGKRLRTV